MALLAGGGVVADPVTVHPLNKSGRMNRGGPRHPIGDNMGKIGVTTQARGDEGWISLEISLVTIGRSATVLSRSNGRRPMLRGEVPVRTMGIIVMAGVATLP